MATFESSISINKSLPDILAAIQDSVRELGWQVLEITADSISLKIPRSFSSYSVNIKINLNKDEESVIMQVRSTTLGVGPINKRNLEGMVGKLINSVSVVLRNTPNSDSNGISEQIEKLSELFNRGILSESEFEAAKKKLLGI